MDAGQMLVITHMPYLVICAVGIVELYLLNRRLREVQARLKRG